jgi:hypothetical protein
LIATISNSIALTQGTSAMTDSQDTQPTHAPETAQQPHGAADQKPEAAATEPYEIAPPFATLIAAIRAAVARDASPEARTAGANACRSILTVLEATPGQPLTSAAPAAAGPGVPIAALLSQPGVLAKLAAMSREQLLDLVRQFTGGTAASAPSPPTAGPRFHIVELPLSGRPGGGR